MQDYTKEELDKKIESFLTKKFEERGIVRHDSKRSKRMLREHGSFWNFFLQPTRPTTQF